MFLVSSVSGAITGVTQSSYTVNQNAGTVAVNFAITSAVAEGGTVAVTFEDYTTISGTPVATLGGNGIPTYTATHSGTAANTLTYTITSSDLGGMVIGDGPYILTITGGSDVVNPQIAGNDVTITVTTSGPEVMTSDITIIPTVTSISPSNRGAGSATTSYTITGYGFGNGEILAGGVTVGGQASIGVTYNSLTSITATGVDVSGLGVGTYDVVVTNNGAAGTGTNIFTLNAAPTVTSAATDTAGTNITITFDKAMADPTGKHLQFTYDVGGGAQAFSAASLNTGNTAQINLTTAGTAIANGDVVTVSYTAGTVTAADTGVLATFAGQAVTNNKAAAPTVTSAATDTAGTNITITFSKAMADPTGKHGQFFYQIGGGGDQAFSAASLNTGNTAQINLTTAGTAISGGDVVTVSYTAGTVTAADTGVLATFVAQAVTNTMAVTPVAGFTGTPTSGIAPTTVYFTDTSTNTPTSWIWNFGDGTTSTAQNPSHAYSAGTYTISMTATNGGGSNTVTRTDYITISHAPPEVSSGDSYTSSSSSGGPVAGTNTPTPTGGTVTLMFDQGISSTNPVGVYELQIVPNQNIGGFQMIAQPVSLGDALQVPDRTVAGYLQIQTVGINPNVIDHATISFEVSESWLTAHGIDPAAVALMRFVDNQWVELPTQFSHQTGNTLYFSATTPGFSYFAITARPVGVPAVTVEPVTTVSETETRVQTFGELAPTETAGSPASGVAVTTQATLVSSPSGTPVPREPSYVPILIIIVCVVVIAGAFAAWRWRQKQENPLLFEK